MNITVMDRQPDNRRRPSSASSIATCIPTRSRRPISTQFLSERWRKHREDDRRPLTLAVLQRAELSADVAVHRHADGFYPKDGGHPGSDLAMMQEQLLDLFNVSYGLMMPLLGRGSDERNVEFGAAMAPRRTNGRRRSGATASRG